MGGFPKKPGGTPKSYIYFNEIFHDKQSILGYPHDYGNFMTSKEDKQRDVDKPARNAPATADTMEDRIHSLEV